ncbi:MAG: hypothetical protein ACI88U_000894 [Porticoccaceae bacterium]
MNIRFSQLSFDQRKLFLQFFETRLKHFYFLG